MIKLAEQSVSKIAIAVFISGIFLTCPAHADNSMKHHGGKDRIDMRIRTLHDNLGVTAEEEPQWKAVAKVMRENEETIHKLVDERHDNESATAIDDLKSYEGIAEAHVDGIKKLIPVFETFYDDLSDKQQARADKLFGKFEGRSGHNKSSKVSTPNNAG